MDATSVRKKITLEQFEEATKPNANVDFTNFIFEFPLNYIFYNKTAIQLNVKFTNCTFKKIEFQNVVFEGKIHFQSCQIEDDFTINNCSFRLPFIAYHLSAKIIRFWDNDFLATYNIGLS